MPTSGWRWPEPSQTTEWCCPARSTAWTRSSSAVVNRSTPSWTQTPPPTGVTNPSVTWTRVGITVANGSGTASHDTPPSRSTTMASRSPSANAAPESASFRMVKR